MSARLTVKRCKQAEVHEQAAEAGSEKQDLFDGQTADGAERPYLSVSLWTEF